MTRITLRPKSVVAALLLSLLFNGTAQEAPPRIVPAALPTSGTGEAETAWLEVLRVGRPLDPPAEWKEHPPKPEEKQQFEDKQIDHGLAAAEKAREFYTRFPDFARATDARKLDYQNVSQAVEGGRDMFGRLADAEVALSNDKSLPEAARIAMRAQSVTHGAEARHDEDRAAVFGEMEKRARQFAQDFPNNSAAYELLLQAAANASSEKMGVIAREVLASQVEEPVKERAREILEALNRIGKPLVIKFTALDGHEVDLAKLKGKVVLVDFWATWCPPCVAEIPNIKKIYEGLKSKGLEVVGISLDEEKDAVTKFVAKERVAWPQFFDGKRWEGKYPVEFKIRALPAMWLVDKKGMLRELAAQTDLEAKVRKLLAE